jgi:flagellar basal-body rod modification protein FlgD
MTVQSIGVNPTSATGLNNAGLGQEDFLKILLTQLQFQDPLKPMDNQEFIAQMAQFTNLEMTRQQNDKVDTLLTIQSASQAVGLIGKTVEVRTETGSEIGSVTTVTFHGGSPVLTVQTGNGAFLTGVTLSQVFIVR